jgi:hypothetical protein
MGRSTRLDGGDVNIDKKSLEKAGEIQRIDFRDIGAEPEVVQFLWLVAIVFEAKRIRPSTGTR